MKGLMQTYVLVLIYANIFFIFDVRINYYMSSNIKMKKAYVLYANAAYFNTVSACVQSIKTFSDVPIIVYMLNSKLKVEGALTINWKCDIEDVTQEAYINRSDNRIYKILIQRPLIVIDALKHAEVVAYVDADSVATKYVDNIFSMFPKDSYHPYFVEGIYDYLHFEGRGGAESKDDLSTTLEHPACELFRVDQYVRERYRQTGYFVASERCVAFLEDWYNMCIHPKVLDNPTYYAPYHEETIVNVLLWSYNIQEGLPYLYVNGSIDTIDEVGKIGFNKEYNYVKPWLKIPKKESDLLFFHGEKDYNLIKQMTNKLKPKLRILYLAPHLSTGGMPQFLLKRIQELKALNLAEICVVEYQCHSLDYVVQRNQIIDLVPVYTLYEDKMELFQIIQQFNPDVIHIDEMSERMDRKMINKLYSNDRKYRIVETCHDVSFNPVVEKVYTPDAYAFCTPYHLDTFDVPGHKEVIEYPINPINVSDAEKLQAKEQLRMDNLKKHVINVGLWTSGKNQGEGLELARKMPDVEFHFIGNQAGNFKDYWEPLMKDVPNNVTIWGERTDVHLFMKAADGFLFNSVNECNPLVLREAISYGLPILARNLYQYKDMLTPYITDLNPLNMENQLAMLLDDVQERDTSYNQSSDFAKSHEKLYNHVMSVIPYKNTINDYNINQHFVGQPFLEITGTSDSLFTVEFYDEDVLIHRSEIRCNHWVRVNREYFTKWRVLVYKDLDLVYDTTLDYTGKRVYISFDSSSLGDTIAWIPYVLEFKKKHNCHVIVSTFKNFLFESVYPELEFVTPGTNVVNIQGMYKLGWFYDFNKEPVLPNTIPLQQTATNILGLEYEEIKPRLIPYNKFTHTRNKTIAIATNSTAGCKFWTREAWQELINYLYYEDYEIINTSLEDNPFDNCEVLEDKSMQNTIDCIGNSTLFIGLSSGLSWLAWALGKQVVMISNFSQEDHEFECIRITNTNVCHGCWNDPQFKFDKGDYNWCPIHKNTPRQFECHRGISAKQVIDTLVFLKDL